jgi:hypothetical protein
MSIRSVTLHTGAVVAEPTLNAVSLTLDSLLTDRPTIFYEVVQIARNDRYLPRSQVVEIIDGYGLTNYGIMHDDVRSSVLALTDGDGLDLHMISPYPPITKSP